MRSEREWGIARQQYQARMEQLQSELEDTQRQLDKVKAGPGTASVQDDTNNKNHGRHRKIVSNGAASSAVRIPPVWKLMSKSKKVIARISFHDVRDDSRETQAFSPP